MRSRSDDHARSSTGRRAPRSDRRYRRAALITPVDHQLRLLATLDEAAYEAGKNAAGEVWVKDWDANSMLWRYLASRNFDASKPFGGDMMKALARIKAPVLLLPSMSDRTIPG